MSIDYKYEMCSFSRTLHFILMPLSLLSVILNQISLEFMYYLHWYLKKVTICLNCLLLLLPTFICCHWRWQIYENSNQNWPCKIYSIIMFRKIFETWMYVYFVTAHAKRTQCTQVSTLHFISTFFKMRQANAFFVGIQHPFYVDWCLCM